MILLLKKGDKCWTRTDSGKKHYGVCVGKGPDREMWFVHNTRKDGVISTTRKGFSGNREIQIEQRAPAGQEDAVTQRALALLGRHYDMIFFNCEHVANLAVNGQATSSQVQTGVVAVGVLLAGLWKANNNGTSVDVSGYRRNGKGQFAKRRWI